jgi:hypothetical protein
MDDQNKPLPGGGLRRVGRKDRKNRIDTRGPLIPLEDDALLEAAAEAEAETEARDEAEVFPEKPSLLTPPAERFPPVNPVEVKRPQTAPAPVKTQRNPLLYNLLALLFACGGVGLLGIYALIAVNPYTPVNPFPPFTPLPIIITATPLPATETPPPTATASPTPGPTASFTPIQLSGANITPEPPAATFTPAPFPFTLTSSGITYAPNGNGQECNWSSIAGSVVNLQGLALDGYGVRVIGEGLDETVYSGSAITFGAGGFELPLGGVPQQAPYTVQLFSPEGAPLSEEYQVVTSDKCDQNVAIVNFIQNRAL